MRKRPLILCHFCPNIWVQDTGAAHYTFHCPLLVVCSSSLLSICLALRVSRSQIFASYLETQRQSFKHSKTTCRNAARTMQALPYMPWIRMFCMNLDHRWIRQASCCWQGRILRDLNRSTNTARFSFWSCVYTAHTNPSAHGYAVHCLEFIHQSLRKLVMTQWVLKVACIAPCPPVRFCCFSSTFDNISDILLMEKIPHATM